MVLEKFISLQVYASEYNDMRQQHEQSPVEIGDDVRMHFCTGWNKKTESEAIAR